MKSYIELFAGLSPLSEILPWKTWRPALIVEKCNYANQIREALHPFTREEARIVEDINDVDKLPTCDLLLAGFPCQPYSTAGKKQGLSDPRALIRKTLDLIEGEPPRALILENVRGILGPQGRETLAMIEETLTRVYGSFQIVESCASDFGPMRRPRVFIVAGWQGGWNRPEIEAQPYHRGALKLLPESDERLSPCYLGASTFKALKAHREKHKARGNGFGFQAISAEGASIPTISARYWKDGSEALLLEGERARRLHPIELARLFGWPSPESARIWDPAQGRVSFTRLAKALGNSIHLGQLAWIVKGFEA